MQKPKSILVIMAMQTEAQPIIKKLNLKRTGKIKLLNGEIFSGQILDAKINILLNGKCQKYFVDQIGTQPATLVTHLGIEKFNPDLIINAGTAGGYKRHNAKVGDIYLSNKHVCFHDRRINIPGFDKYGIGYYPSVESEQIAKTLNTRLGIVTSGNSLNYTDKDMRLIKGINGEVKDMEAAAIAWVANLYNKPFIAIKSITDIVDGEKPAEEEFVQNLEFASEILCKKTIELLNYFAHSDCL
ncbi:MAG: hypothetical protein ACLFNU_02780 [Bacteroidales bacterium]